MQHRDEDVRASAVKAIRRLETPAATRALIGCLDKDPSSDVRANAAEVLSTRSGSEVLDALTRLLRSEKKELVRRAAIVGLGCQKDYDARARQLLEQVRDADPEKRLRDLAARILNGRRGV